MITQIILAAAMIGVIDSTPIDQNRVKAARALAAQEKLQADPFTAKTVEIVLPDGISVFIDPVSGCQYFVTTDVNDRANSITPRMTREHTHYCP